jgi:hypothetical protein
MHLLESLFQATVALYQHLPCPRRIACDGTRVEATKQSELPSSYEAIRPALSSFA